MHRRNVTTLTYHLVLAVAARQAMCELTLNDISLCRSHFRHYSHLQSAAAAAAAVTDVKHAVKPNVRTRRVGDADTFHCKQ